MFFGSYEYIIDSKGRTALPSKFKEAFGNVAYALKGYEGCLSLYTNESFEKFMTKLTSLPYEKGKARLHQRILLSSTDELNIDKQGRLQIPQKIIKKYGFSKEIVMIGVLDHLEIWDKESYEKYLSENEEEFEKNAEDLLSNEEWLPHFSSP